MDDKEIEEFVIALENHFWESKSYHFCPRCNRFLQGIDVENDGTCQICGSYVDHQYINVSEENFGKIIQIIEQLQKEKEELKKLWNYKNWIINLWTKTLTYTYPQKKVILPMSAVGQ